MPQTPQLNYRLLLLRISYLTIAIGLFMLAVQPFFNDYYYYIFDLFSDLRLGAAIMTIGFTLGIISSEAQSSLRTSFIGMTITGVILFIIFHFIFSKTNSYEGFDDSVGVLIMLLLIACPSIIGAMFNQIGQSSGIPATTATKAGFFCLSIPMIIIFLVVVSESSGPFDSYDSLMTTMKILTIPAAGTAIAGLVFGAFMMNHKSLIDPTDIDEDNDEDYTPGSSADRALTHEQQSKISAMPLDQLKLLLETPSLYDNEVINAIKIEVEVRGIVSKHTDRELVDMLAHPDIYHPTVLAGVKEELFRRDSPMWKIRARLTPGDKRD